MKIDEMKDLILRNIEGAIADHDNRVCPEYRITAGGDDIIDFESNDTLQFYLPYTVGGHRMIGHLKLTVELEDL